MLPYLREHFGNPSSSHAYGARARSAVAQARRQVAALLGCDEDEVVFTSGGTEANNLAIHGVAEAREDRRHIVTTAIEHPATERPCAWLARHGWTLTRLGVDEHGRARLDEARSAIGERTALVTVMHSNNETGVLQPVAELAEIAHAAGVVVHTDAAQSIGKVPVRVRELGVDLLSIAGHKLYAPKGVGALYVKRGTPLAPLLPRCGPRAGNAPRHRERRFHRRPRRRVRAGGERHGGGRSSHARAPRDAVGPPLGRRPRARAQRPRRASAAQHPQRALPSRLGRVRARGGRRRWPRPPDRPATKGTSAPQRSFSRWA
jgi:selenocysteine lyase/cysteine desulfurase